MMVQIEVKDDSCCPQFREQKQFLIFHNNGSFQGKFFKNTMWDSLVLDGF